MKFLVTSSLIIGAVFLLGASTSLNAIDTQQHAQQNSNILKAGHHGGGGHGHHGRGGHGYHGGGGHHGYHHGHHGWNGGWGGWGGGFYGGPGLYSGPDYYYGGPDYYADPGLGVCVGPLCLGL